jgi:hypothetical protein
MGEFHLSLFLNSASTGARANVAWVFRVAGVAATLAKGDGG